MRSSRRRLCCIHLLFHTSFSMRDLNPSQRSFLHGSCFVFDKESNRFFRVSKDPSTFSLLPVSVRLRLSQKKSLSRLTESGPVHVTPNQGGSVFDLLCTREIGLLHPAAFTRKAVQVLWRQKIQQTNPTPQEEAISAEETMKMLIGDFPDQRFDRRLMIQTEIGGLALKVYESRSSSQCDLRLFSPIPSCQFLTSHALNAPVSSLEPLPSWNRDDGSHFRFLASERGSDLSRASISLFEMQRPLNADSDCVIDCVWSWKLPQGQSLHCASACDDREGWVLLTGSRSLENFDLHDGMRRTRSWKLDRSHEMMASCFFKGCQGQQGVVANKDGKMLLFDQRQAHLITTQSSAGPLPSHLLGLSRNGSSSFLSLCSFEQKVLLPSLFSFSSPTTTSDILRQIRQWDLRLASKPFCEYPTHDQQQKATFVNGFFQMSVDERERVLCLGQTILSSRLLTFS